MSKPVPFELSEAHYAAFGKIVSLYANCESSFKMALVEMVQIDAMDLFILTEPYTSLNLKNVAKSIAKIKLGPKAKDKFVGLLGSFGTFAKIRNDIAHNSWCEGERVDSIRPLKISIREGKVRLFGIDDSEKDYTLTEIQKVADDMVRLYADLDKFMNDMGFLQSISKKIERKSISSD